MTISDFALSVAECRSIANVYETYKRYRKAMELIAAAEHLWKQHQALRNLVELRDQYLAAIKAVTLDVEHGWDYKAYERYLQHIKKTIAGLVQLILQHAVRKLRLSQLPLSLLCRVRQITITHPAIAPPQFA